MCTAETFAVVAIDYHPSGRLLATADGHGTNEIMRVIIARRLLDRPDGDLPR